MTSKPEEQPRIKRIPFEVDALLSQYDPDRRLEKYFEVLMNENAKVNLVSRETQLSDLRRLAAESVLPLELIRSDIGSYLEIGAGGGFPSIPIILSFRSGLKAVLVERTLRKATALDRIVSSLSLKVQIIPRTFEEIKFDDQFDLVTLRWVKLSPTLLRKIRQFLSPGGCLIHYSAPLPKGGGFDVTACEFLCPESSATKQFTIYKKKLQK